MDIAKHFESHPMSQAERQAINRQVVLFCVIDMRPFNTVTGEGFGCMVNALNPRYARETIHHTTVQKILDILCSEVKEAITDVLRSQRDSCLRVGWYGPFVAVQADLTSAHNREYATMSLSFVPETCDEVVRLGICTKALHGTHTAADIAKWVEEVRLMIAWRVFERTFE